MVVKEGGILVVQVLELVLVTPATLSADLTRYISDGEVRVQATNGFNNLICPHVNLHQA